MGLRIEINESFESEAELWVALNIIASRITVGFRSTSNSPRFQVIDENTEGAR